MPSVFCMGSKQTANHAFFKIPEEFLANKGLTYPGTTLFNVFCFEIQTFFGVCVW